MLKDQIPEITKTYRRQLEGRKIPFLLDAIDEAIKVKKVAELRLDAGDEYDKDELQAVIERLNQLIKVLRDGGLMRTE